MRVLHRGSSAPSTATAATAPTPLERERPQGRMPPASRPRRPSAGRCAPRPLALHETRALGARQFTCPPLSREAWKPLRRPGVQSCHPDPALGWLGQSSSCLLPAVPCTVSSKRFLPLCNPSNTHSHGAQARAPRLRPFSRTRRCPRGAQSAGATSWPGRRPRNSQAMSRYRRPCSAAAPRPASPALRPRPAAGRNTGSASPRSTSKPPSM